MIAPVAPTPIRKGRFTAAFLARLLYQKYVLGLPVHRIVRVLGAEGLDVAEGTVSGAVRAVADLLVPRWRRRSRCDLVLAGEPVQDRSAAQVRTLNRVPEPHKVSRNTGRSSCRADRQP